MKMIIVSVCAWFLASSAYAQNMSMREFFKFDDKVDMVEFPQTHTSKDLVLRDFEKWFSNQKKARFVYSVDLDVIGIPMTLRAQKRIWEEDLGGSGTLILQGNKLTYVYAPQNFGPGSVERSFKPLLQKIFRVFD